MKSKSRFRSAVVFGAILAGAAALPAMGDDLIEVGGAAAVEEAPPTVVIDPSLLESAPRVSVGDDTWVTLDVLVGVPSAVRVRFFPHLSLSENGNGRLSVEAMYGGTATAAGFVEMVGAGLRIHIEIPLDHVNDALFLSPGVNFYLGWDSTPDTGWFDFGPDSTVLFMTANAEFSWVHQFARHFGFELGLRVGAGIVASGLDSTGTSAAGEFTPELALFAGFRF